MSNIALTFVKCPVPDESVFEVGAHGSWFGEHNQHSRDNTFDNALHELPRWKAVGRMADCSTPHSWKRERCQMSAIEIQNRKTVAMDQSFDFVCV